MQCVTVVLALRLVLLYLDFVGKSHAAKEKAPAVRPPGLCCLCLCSRQLRHLAHEIDAAVRVAELVVVP